MTTTKRKITLMWSWIMGWISGMSIVSFLAAIDFHAPLGICISLGCLALGEAGIFAFLIHQAWHSIFTCIFCGKKIKGEGPAHPQCYTQGCLSYKKEA